MKKLRHLLLLVPLALGISLGDSEAESERYRIAAIIPLSGQVASLGNYVKKGIDLGLENLPVEQRSKIELVYEDDQFNPLQSISAYRKLQSSSQVDAVFTVGSPPANGLGPITERDKTVLVAIGASDPSIAVGRNYSFIHWVTPPVLGEKLSEELISRNLKRIAFVVAEVTGAIADANAAIDALKRKGKSELVVYHQTFLKDATDYRTALLQIKDKRADAVVAVLFPGALAAFAGQFRETQIPAELVGMETFEDESEVKASRGALIGAWYVNAAASTNDFVSLYRRRYGEHPGWGAANGYDSVNLIAAAVAKVGRNNEAVRDFLRSVKDYSGATGVFSASGDNRFTLPAAVKLVSANGFEDITAAGREISPPITKLPAALAPAREGV